MEKFLAIKVEDSYCCIPLQFIRHVFQSTYVHQYPQKIDNIEGVVNVHGDLYPVISMRFILNKPYKKIELQDHFVLINFDSTSLILVVDRILEIFDEREIEYLNDAKKNNGNIISETFNVNKEIVFMLNVKEIVKKINADIMNSN